MQGLHQVQIQVQLQIQVQVQQVRVHRVQVLQAVHQVQVAEVTNGLR